MHSVACGTHSSTPHHPQYTIGSAISDPNVDHDAECLEKPLSRATHLPANFPSSPLHLINLRPGNLLDPSPRAGGSHPSFQVVRPCRACATGRPLILACQRPAPASCAAPLRVGSGPSPKVLLGIGGLGNGAVSSFERPLAPEHDTHQPGRRPPTLLSNMQRRDLSESHSAGSRKLWPLTDTVHPPLSALRGIDILWVWSSALCAVASVLAQLAVHTGAPFGESQAGDLCRHVAFPRGGNHTVVSFGCGCGKD
ncbi:hypothetical protein B0J18DRAFT_134254 [Chaetomium sp. MPI-SDFR-AT-0129]|nr:hypothetical protein B0J18DRAFT_134254 [Chaetomium sp. MPI-SDFR-AT-0129]